MERIFPNLSEDCKYQCTSLPPPSPPNTHTSGAELYLEVYANEIHTFYEKLHKVSPSSNSHLNGSNYVELG